MRWWPWPPYQRTIHGSIWAIFKVLPGLLHTGNVKDGVERPHYALDVLRGKTAVLHSIDDIATAALLFHGSESMAASLTSLFMVYLLDFLRYGSAVRYVRPVIRQQFSSRAPAQLGMGPEGTAASLSACGSWPWGGLSHLRRWCLFARSPWREVTAHPPPGSPQMAWFPSQCRAEEEKISLYLPRSL